MSRPPTFTVTVANCSVAILIPIPPLCFTESGGLSQLLPEARSNFHPPAWLSLASLPPEAELLDQGAVALEIVPLEIVEQSPPSADELEQPAARIVILRVRSQMPRQLVDASCEERDLHLRRPGIGPVPAVLVDDLQLRFLGEGHDTSA